MLVFLTVIDTKWTPIWTPNYIMTDKQLINKNRKSKLNKLIDDISNEIIKPEVYLGQLAKKLETPYNRLLSFNNPFLFKNAYNYDKALILFSLIDKIHEFSIDCVDPNY